MQFIQYVSSARLVNSTGAALQKYIIIPILFVHGSQHLVEGSSLKDKMLAALFPGHRTTALPAYMHLGKPSCKKKWATCTTFFGRQKQRFSA